MKKIGIIAAMQEEVKALHEALADVKETEIAGMTFIEGLLLEKAVVVVQSGIGKVNASIATVCLIQNFDCEAIVNTGSGGGIGHGLAVGDVVISKQMSYFDADARVFGYEMGQIPQMPLFYESSNILRKETKKAAEKIGLHVKEGLILSGDSFVSGGALMETIKNNFPDSLVVEMEGAAVAQTCFRFNIPFLIVRAVSDTADGDAASSFDTFIIEAGKKSAEMVIGLVRSLE